MRDRIGRSRGYTYNHHQKEYELSVNISNKNIDCLLLCKALFGGRTYIFNTDKVPCRRWVTEGKKALKFLESVFPYVIVKKPHIEAILNNLENKEYAYRLLRVLNTRGVVNYPKLPLM